MSTTDIAIQEAPNAAENVPMTEVSIQDVRIFADHVTIPVAGGIEKVISLEDFRTLLNTTLGRTEDEKLDGFSLPSNVFYFAKSGDQVQISCYYQARVAEIIYNTRKMKIVMPNIIISHTLRKAGDKEWRVIGSRYFCTDLGVSRLPREFLNSVDPRRRIFLLPMSNTYSEGNMCFGQNSMPSRFVDNNLRGLDWYYQYMFESPFNDDLGIYAINRSYRVSEWYDRLADLAVKGESFPYNELSGFTAA